MYIIIYLFSIGYAILVRKLLESSAYPKYFIILLLVIALNSVHTTAEENVHSQKPRSHHNGRAHKSHKVVATANHMGYMDIATNKLSRKFLDFAPHAPGHIMDLGCAWGYAIEQILAIERRKPFLGK